MLDRYLREVAAGARPDQESYLRAHPDLAEPLRGVFRTLEFVEATGRCLHSADLERGRTLGDFRILREIGRGGMGVVYEAVQISLKRHVALKVLPASALLSGGAPERFRREAATAARLHHTNIVPVHASGVEDGVEYYAMQYIEGGSLASHLEWLRKSAAPPGRDYFECVARWGMQAAEALAYAHANGAIHRDIKPSNLLLDRRGRAARRTSSRHWCGWGVASAPPAASTCGRAWTRACLFTSSTAWRRRCWHGLRPTSSGRTGLKRTASRERTFESK
ncbi:Serine/threonine-protein kinase PrkC [Phycisphaerae bacterium RAS1]|nr:Serine/threonine-protein kinase PrkC [Phycisphaerae bacterium RAS1]